MGFPGDTSGKEPACKCWRHDSWGGFLGQEDLLEAGMATHSSIFAWKSHEQRSLVGYSP